MNEQRVVKLPVGVVVTDPSGNVVVCTDAAAALHAKPAEGGDDEGFHLVRPDGAPRDLSELPLSRALRTGEAVRLDRLPVLDAAGQERVLTIDASPMRGPDGRIVLAVAVRQEADDPESPEDERREHARDPLEQLQDITVALGTAHTSEEVLDVVLQANLLPPRLPEIPGVDLVAAYLAAGNGVHVGGHFYDVIELDRGRWLVAVGDVRGKGIEAASMTGIARHTIRAVAECSRAPSEALRQLNTALRRADRERDSAEEEPQFATVCAVLIEPSVEGARLTVCAAGHPLPLVRRQDGTVESVGVTGMAVGIFDDCELTDAEAHLRSGEVLVCMTDGLLERRDGDDFFEDRLHERIASLTGEDAPTIAAQLKAEAEAFSPDPPSDDMAVLGRSRPRGVAGARRAWQARCPTRS